MDITAYRDFLIKNILAWQTRGQFTAEELHRMPTRVLETIHDNID